MLTSIPVTLLVGTILGFLAGIGAGGGSLLILWLTAVIGMEQPVARSINLMFFLPAALVSCFFRWKKGVLQVKQIILPALAGCVAAFLSSRLGEIISTDILDKLFGGLLLFTAFRELRWKPKK